jgi:hypothetical protein
MGILLEILRGGGEKVQIFAASRVFAFLWVDFASRW